MNLGELWEWNKRKLQCRVHVESGNPLADDLRERLAELAGVNVHDLLKEMKTQKKKRKKEAKGAEPLSSDSIEKTVTHRAFLLGAAELSLKHIEHKNTGNASKNIHKKFVQAPRSPPKRVVLDLQRERAKPFSVPEPTTAEEDEFPPQATVKFEKPEKTSSTHKRRVHIRGNTRTDNLFETGTLETPKGLPQSPPSLEILRPYSGDKFSTAGQYLHGLLYLSRMSPTHDGHQAKQSLALNESIKDETLYRQSALDTQSSEGENIADGNGAFLRHEQTANAEQLSSKLYCAMSLCNWSRNAMNAQRLAREGAVTAILQLAPEPNHEIKVHAAAAMRYMSEHRQLATVLIAQGAIHVMADLVNGNQDDRFICGNIAIALLNLTKVDGEEAKLVEDGLVNIVMVLMASQPALSLVCARSLYNLTCVDTSYPLIERIVRCLVTVAVAALPDVKHACVAALCNLSDLKSIRGRMVEEGVIAVVTATIRSSEGKTRRVCAVLLQNLSTTKTCRTEMVARGSVQALVTLASDKDNTVLRCVAITLSRLANESQNVVRIVNEGGIGALASIASRLAHVPGVSQAIAVALQLLASRASVRTDMVAEGAMTATATLLQHSTDVLTLQYTLVTLVSLLLSKEHHPVAMECQIASSVLNLTTFNDEIVKSLSVLALFNLSRSEAAVMHMINLGCTAALVKLASSSWDVVRRRCSAALCNLSCEKACHDQMVKEGVFDALTALLKSEDQETFRFTCAALCKLASNETNCLEIAGKGAIPAMVIGANRNGDPSQPLCCAVLTALSYYESCRERILSNGALPAFMKLVTSHDDSTKQQCLMALANLSSEPSLQRVMVKAGVVRILGGLTNSYHEANLVYTAKTLCNLASLPELQHSVAVQGGVHVIMMISMVWAVRAETKGHCLQALLNLLTCDDCIDILLDEDLVVNAAHLCSKDDAEIFDRCALIFNRIVKFPRGRDQMTQRRAVLQQLYELQNKGSYAQMLCTRTVCNLLQSADVQERVVTTHGLQVVRNALVSTDMNQDTKTQCVTAAYVLSVVSSYRSEFINARMMDALASVVKQYSSGLIKQQALNTLCNLAWFHESRVELQNEAFLKSMIEIVQGCVSEEELTAASWTLVFMLFNWESNSAASDVHTLLPALETMIASTNSEILLNACLIIRLLCEHTVAARRAILPHVTNLLVKLSANCNDEARAYHILAVIYLLMNVDRDACQLLCSSSVLDIVKSLAHYDSVCDLVAATIARCSLDAVCRDVLAKNDMARTLVLLMECAKQESTICNVIVSVYTLSKLNDCKESFVRAGAAQSLYRLSNEPSSKVKSQCSRALKNFSSQDHNPDGALEEGTVAALIALSLEGKVNDTPESDQAEEPTVLPLQEAAYGPLPSIDDVLKVEPSLWFVELNVEPGGPAGPLVETPDPPAPEAEIPEEQTSQLRHISLHDAEGQTNMAFAKLSVPRAMANKYTFTDEDFNMVRVNDAVTQATTAAEAVAAQSPQDLDSPQHEDISTDNFAAADELQLRRSEQQPPMTAPEQPHRARGVSEPPRSAAPSFDSFGQSMDAFPATTCSSLRDSPKSRSPKRPDHRKSSNRARVSTKSVEYDLGIHAAELGLWTN